MVSMPVGRERESGMAQSESDDLGALTMQRQAQGGGARAQLRRARKDSWTSADAKAFMEALALTCNASEAARMAGKSRAGAYKRRLRDPQFATAWDRAIDIGYAEIEAMMMREALFGTEVEEIVLDGDGVVKSRKVKRGRDQKVALTLLKQHMDRVAKGRAAQMRDGPDAEGALAKMRRALEDIRRRRAAVGE